MILFSNKLKVLILSSSVHASIGSSGIVVVLVCSFFTSRSDLLLYGQGVDGLSGHNSITDQGWVRSEFIVCICCMLVEVEFDSIMWSLVSQHFRRCVERFGLHHSYVKSTCTVQGSAGSVAPGSLNFRHSSIEREEMQNLLHKCINMRFFKMVNETVNLKIADSGLESGMRKRNHLKLCSF